MAESHNFKALTIVGTVLVLSGLLCMLPAVSTEAPGFWSISLSALFAGVPLLVIGLRQKETAEQ